GDTSYVLKPDATVAAWGDNSNGQTNIPGSLTGVTAIAAGGDHAMALKSNGTVQAWGKIWNGSGYVNEIVPVGLTGVTAIAAGAYHAVAIAAAQPPIITTSPPASLTVTQGGTATLSIVASGAVSYQWRKNGVAIPGATGATLLINNAQTGDASSYSVLVTNAYGSVTSTAVTLTVNATTAGSVVAWGAGTTNTGTDPEFGQSMVPSSLGSGVTAVAGGLYHSVALKYDGTVAAWGYNGYGQSTIPAGLSTVNAVASLPYTSVNAVATFQPNPYYPSVNTCSITVSPSVNPNLIMAAIVPGMTVSGPANSVGYGALITSKVTSGNVTTLTFSVVNAMTDSTVVNPFNATLTIATPAGWGSNPVAVTVTPSSNTTFAAAKVLSGMVVTGPPGSLGIGATVVSKTTIATTNPVGSVNILALSQPHLVSPQGEMSLSITPANPVTAVAAGAFHSLALRKDGSVVAWGAGTSSTASTGTAHLTQSYIPAGLTTLTNVAATIPRNDTGLISTVTLSAANAGIIPGMLCTGPADTVGIGAKVLSVSGTIITLSVSNRNASSTPTVLNFYSNVTAIAAGYYHSVALRNDGSIIAWGDNTAGQTSVPNGMQTTSTSTLGLAATLLPNPSGIVNNVTLSASSAAIAPDMLVTGPPNSVAAGAAILYKASASPFALTLSAPNAVNAVTLAVSLLFTPGVKAVAIAAGNEHTMALRADGSIICWGRNVEGQTSTSGLSPITASATLPGTITATVNIPAGPASTVSLTAANAAIIPGMMVTGGAPGTIGDGATLASKDADGVTLTLSVPNTNAAALTGVTLVFAAQANNTITLAAANPAIIPGMYVNGPVSTVGTGATVLSKAADNVTLTLSTRNAYIGNTDLSAQTLAFSAGIKATAIAAGGDTSYVLKPDATVAAWGDNSNGQTNIPGSLTGVTAIAAGGDHAMALKSNGTVQAWGKIWNGSGYVNEIVPVGLTGVTAIAAGAYHAVAIAAAQPPIITTSPPASLTVTQGGTATLSIVASGAVSYQWRKNGVAIPGATGATLLINNAQTGDASSYSVLVTNAYGSVTSTAVTLTVNATTAGSVVAWGAGTTNTGTDPEFGQSMVPSSLGSGVTAVAGGLYHSVALKYDGTVAAWGYNGYGQSTIPAGLSTVNAVASLPYTSVNAVATFQPNPYYPSVNTCSITVSPSVNPNLIMAAIVPGMTVSGPANSVGYGALITSKVTSGNVTTLTFSVVNAMTDSTVVNPFNATLTIATPAGWGSNPVAVTVTPSSNTTFAAAKVLSGMVVTGPPGSLGIGATVVSKTTIATTNPVGSVNILALSQPHLVSPQGEMSLSITPANPVTAVAAGAFHSLALRKDGSVVAWGAGTSSTASTGTAHLTQSYIPAGLTTLTNVAATIPRNDTGLISTVTLSAANAGIIPGMLCTGPADTVGIGAKVLSVSGTIITLSVSNRNASSTPTVLNFYSNVTAIAAGYYHSVALRNDGSIIAWGDNTAGQTSVPNGMQTTSTSTLGLAATLLPNPSGIVNNVTLSASSAAIAPDMLVTGPPNSVAAGAAILYKASASPFALTLSAPNAVNAVTLAVSLLFTPGVKAVAIAAGNEHTMALRADGS
ncbi:MAG: hypothetical protein WCP35_18950, partial [Verrucomicrobiota bacterium]